MQHEEIRHWTVGETVRIQGDDRLMTVVRCHDDGTVAVAWFEGRKMHLERVPSEQVELVISEVAPPGIQRQS